jgi:two-component system response regulator FlrC
MSAILVVDDEEAMRESLALHLTRSGHRVVARADVAGACEAIAAEDFDAVITDLRLPGGNGIAVVEEVRRHQPETPVVVITAYATVDTAVEAMKRGAFDYIQKPFRLDELDLVLERALRWGRVERENEALRARIASERIEAVWGPSEAGREVEQRIRAVAAADATVLLTGESGTGKEVAARMIHEWSPRRNGPFLAVNCAALSAGLLESELFGHEKGAFTGADRMRRGRFELADGGTLLLDEVSEIEPALQAKLLRVLQEKTFERVGSSRPRRTDVRIIATTNRDLAAEVEAGRFRRDLYFRLNVVPITLPPLRERREDIPALVLALLRRLPGGAGRTVAPEAMRLLEQHSWPGNVRELANLLERIVVLSPAPVIRAEDVARWLEPARGPEHDPLERLESLNVEDVIDRLIAVALRRSGGNKEEAARALGMTSRGLRERLKRRPIPS